MPSLPSVSDLKTYLGLTGTGDDTMLAERIQTAIGMAERDTGRAFSASSNTTRYYSSMNETVVSVSDRPFTDASRVVTWNGVTMTENTNCWFLPDRRDANNTRLLQLRYFDVGNPWWYKADPYWFDKNLDNPRRGIGGPNDIKITGIEGIPYPRSEVTGAIIVLAAFLYWRAKSGASGSAYDNNGTEFTLADTPPEYQAFVKDWMVHTAVGYGG